MKWLAAFLFTQAIEVPIWMTALARSTPRPHPSFAHRALIAFGASLLTHPLVWFVLPWLLPPALSFQTKVLFLEAFAIGIEAAYMRAFGMRYAILWSLLANTASAGIGLTLRHFFGFP
jgi:hypothetical protein